MNTSTQAAKDQIACHCLKVYRSQVESAVTDFGYSEFREVMDHTKAGQGCMSCRKRICKMIQQAKQG